MRPNVFLLVYDDDFGTYNEVRRLVDTCPGVDYWYRCLPNAIFLTSQRTASELTRTFLDRSGERGRFLVLDTDADRDGWLPGRAWDLMNHPESVREPDRLSTGQRARP